MFFKNKWTSHVKDLAQDVAEDVLSDAKNGSDLAQDVAENVLSDAKNRSAKVFIVKVYALSIVKARAKPLRRCTTRAKPALRSFSFEVDNLEPHGLRGPGGTRSPRHATTAAAAVSAQLALRWGRNWAAQWHLVRAVGKRFRG